MNKLICSCPGKVLLAGGYAILNSQNHGLSIAVDVQFKTQRTLLQQEGQLILHSPQFNQTITYNTFNKDLQITENKYFDAIFQVLQKYSLLSKESWKITTLPDLAFYANQNNISIKSGFGSSACLIVSCLSHFVNDNDILYKYAKEANFIAQNNVGSGFDISTAIFGSQLFNIKSPIPLNIPTQKFKLLVIDLKKGQSTIKGVNTVKSYLQNDPKLYKEFLECSETTVQQLASTLLQPYQDKNILKDLNNQYRKMLRQLGNMANFPIEPEISTKIIDFSLQLPSTLWGICPGAGGYDAIVILCKDIQDTEITQLKTFLEMNQMYDAIQIIGLANGGINRKI